MNYERINTVFAKALIAGKSGLFEIFLLICIERPELPVVRNYLTLLYIEKCKKGEYASNNETSKN